MIDRRYSMRRKKGGEAEVRLFLADSRVKTHYKDHNGVAPLDYAERQGNEEVATLLRQHAAS